MPASPAQKRIRLTVLGLFLLVGLVVALVLMRQMLWAPGAREVPPPPDLTDINTYVYDPGQPVASFELTDETGATVTNADFKGRWTFAFVGFTHCPDICPATLAMLRQTDKQIPDDLPEPRYLMISADPERDTPERLQKYLDFFGDNFDGLTGDRKTLQKLARSLNATFSQTTASDGAVQVNHSAHVSLLNPDGELIAVIQPPHQPETVSQAFEAIYQWARQKRQIRKGG
jgi:protein SCO1/2